MAKFKDFLVESEELDENQMGIETDGHAKWLDDVRAKATVVPYPVKQVDNYNLAGEDEPDEDDIYDEDDEDLEDYLTPEERKDLEEDLDAEGDVVEEELEALDEISALKASKYMIKSGLSTNDENEKLKRIDPETKPKVWDKQVNKVFNRVKGQMRAQKIIDKKTVKEDVGELTEAMNVPAALAGMIKSKLATQDITFQNGQSLTLTLEDAQILMKKFHSLSGGSQHQFEKMLNGSSASFMSAYDLAR